MFTKCITLLVWLTKLKLWTLITKVKFTILNFYGVGVFKCFSY